MGSQIALDPPMLNRRSITIPSTGLWESWSIKASNDFFDSVTKSTTMIIQIVCPEGGIWVHQGAVRDGYAPKSAAGAQECSGAVTLTEFVGYQSSDVGFTVYLPDGVEGYFPYTVVASAA